MRAMIGALHLKMREIIGKHDFLIADGLQNILKIEFKLTVHYIFFRFIHSKIQKEKSTNMR